MSTNKNFHLKKRKEPSVEQILAGIQSGDRYLLAQGITWLESKKPQHRVKAHQLINQALQQPKKSIRIGITGVPGVGKSTFIESFGTTLADAGHQVAVLTIDPSSQMSKGSILGDKTRMETLSVHPSVFIRPSPSGDSLGGVAQTTKESILLCEAAGFDVVIVETVGVGQSETEVHSMVDFFMLLMLPGAGDELQGIKRGIMEMADLIVINKADGQNEKKARLAQKQLAAALHYFPPNPNGWTTPVMTCSALKHEGISELWDKAQDFLTQVQENNHFENRRGQQSLQWFRQSLTEKLKSRFLDEPKVQERIKDLEKAIVQGQVSPFYAADQLLDEI
ncbi:methylmalonyl Co-A mutase-associated GTPase MeaB [bacterium SCSIO 12741]|nr:methylmalonyl Co-A mutase-associated GTPase MeaB [bacterium SCSIO 12741]